MKTAPPIDRFSDLHDTKRFRSALNELQRTHDTSRNPENLLLITYNMGAIHWWELGNGQRARELFLETVRIIRGEQLQSDDEIVKTILANNYENLMLLSLSYEEYESWSQQLRKIQPDNHIFLDQVPVFLNAQEEGHPWSDMLQDIARSYYNRSDANSDRGYYGCGASIWHLLLTNRKVLRVGRENWKDAVFEFGALALRITSDAKIAMERSTQGYDPSECLFIIDPAIQFVEEYLSVDPNDKQLEELKTTLNGYYEEMQQKYEKDIPEQATSQSIKTAQFSKPLHYYSLVLLSVIVLGAGIGWAIDGLPSMMIGTWISLVLGLQLKGLFVKSDSSTSRLETEPNNKSRSIILTKIVKCWGCNEKMTIFLGVKHPGIFPRQVLVHQSHKWCYQCAACGRYYCWDCSDSRKPCSCGAKLWQEKLYFPAGVSPEQALKYLI